MLLQIDSLASKKIGEYVSSGYWQHGDFWINVIIGILAIWIGWKAYKEAGKAFREAGDAKNAATAARDAALKAGKTVKKQSILLAIPETIRMCQMRNNTSYEDTNNKVMEITGKVRNIIGLFREDLGQNGQGLLQKIETANSDVMTQFNLLDPDANSQTIYNGIRPYVVTLTGHLYELQGVIENELISNNT